MKDNHIIGQIGAARMRGPIFDEAMEAAAIEVALESQIDEVMEDVAIECALELQAEAETPT